MHPRHRRADLPPNFNTAILDIPTTVDRWTQRVLALAPTVVNGPDFVRGVRDNLATAVRMAEHGHRHEEAEYWLTQAEQHAAAAATRRGRDKEVR